MEIGYGAAGGNARPALNWLTREASAEVSHRLVCTSDSCLCEPIEEGCVRPHEPQTEKPGHDRTSIGERREVSGNQPVTR